MMNEKEGQGWSLVLSLSLLPHMAECLLCRPENPHNGAERSRHDQSYSTALKRISLSQLWADSMRRMVPVLPRMTMDVVTAPSPV